MHPNFPVIAGFIYKITIVMMMGPNKNNQTSKKTSKPVTLSDIIPVGTKINGGC